MNKRIVLALLCTGAVLAACGQGNDGGPVVTPTPTPVPTPTPTPAPMADAFTQQVQQLIATTSDTTTPVPIDGISLTTSETTSPVAVQ